MGDTKSCRYFSWFGRQMLLTVLPAKVRKQQQLGDPVHIAAAAVKLGLKFLFDLTDLMPDPAVPALLEEYRKVKGWQWNHIDSTVEREKIRQSRVLEIIVFAILAACIMWLLRF